MSPAALAGRRCRTISTCACPSRADAESNLGSEGAGESDRPWQLLVRIEPAGVDPDARGSWRGGRQRPSAFRADVRETGVFAGVIFGEERSKDGEDRCGTATDLCAARRDVRAYSFPLRTLATVAGRPMLGGLKLMLDRRLFTDADDRDSEAAKESREAQTAVSTELAEQVLGALHELLRGLHAAEPDRDRAARAAQARAPLRRPAHRPDAARVPALCRGSRPLAVAHDGAAKELTRPATRVRGLYAAAGEDAALNPDTMDERRGGWGRLLALFRLIHKGHPQPVDPAARRQAVRS